MININKAFNILTKTLVFCKYLIRMKIKPEICAHTKVQIKNVLKRTQNNFIRFFINRQIKIIFLIIKMSTKHFYNKLKYIE